MFRNFYMQDDTNISKKHIFRKKTITSHGYSLGRSGVLSAEYPVMQYLLPALIGNGGFFLPQNMENN
jgi:hypothetical protein